MRFSHVMKNIKRNFPQKSQNITKILKKLKKKKNHFSIVSIKKYHIKNIFPKSQNENTLQFPPLNQKKIFKRKTNLRIFLL